MNSTQDIYKMFSRMSLNTESMIDEGFSKSIKFVVGEHIKNDVPQVHYYDSFHEMLLQAFKLHLNGKLWSVGVMDRQKNYNGSNALEHWTDAPLKNAFDEMQKDYDGKLARLEKLEKLVKKFGIDDKKIDEYIKD